MVILWTRMEAARTECPDDPKCYIHTRQLILTVKVFIFSLSYSADILIICFLHVS